MIKISPTSAFPHYRSHRLAIEHIDRLLLARTTVDPKTGRTVAAQGYDKNVRLLRQERADLLKRCPAHELTTCIADTDGTVRHAPTCPNVVTCRGA